MRHALIVIVLMLFLSACGRSATDLSRKIDQAEYDIENGNNESAREICDGIMEAASNGTELTAVQLCRIAGIYAALSETDVEEQDASLATAVRCLDAANAIDADSVSAFIRRLPVDEQGSIAMLLYLTSDKGDKSGSITDDDIDTAAVINTPAEGYAITDSL